MQFCYTQHACARARACGAARLAKLTLMGVASNLARGIFKTELESFKTQTHREMESARGGKRRRSKAVAGADNSLIADVRQGYKFILGNR